MFSSILAAGASGCGLGGGGDSLRPALPCPEDWGQGAGGGEGQGGEGGPAHGLLRYFPIMPHISRDKAETITVEQVQAGTLNEPSGATVTSWTPLLQPTSAALPLLTGFIQWKIALYHLGYVCYGLVHKG